jgi:hypothetical protein
MSLHLKAGETPESEALKHFLRVQVDLERAGLTHTLYSLNKLGYYLLNMNYPVEECAITRTRLETEHPEILVQERIQDLLLALGQQD